MFNFLLQINLQDKQQDKKLQVLLLFTGIKEKNTGLAKGGGGKGSYL